METIETLELTETVTESTPAAAPAPEMQLSEEERQRWIWTFERLKAADLGLTLTEKARIFCNANTPEELEELIQSGNEPHNVLKLVA